MSNSFKFTPELLQEINLALDEESDKIEIVEEGDWVDDGKYSYRSNVFKMDDKFYQYHESRSGSYHTDYYYSDPEDYHEVKQVEKIVKVWEAL